MTTRRTVALLLALLALLFGACGDDGSADPINGPRKRAEAQRRAAMEEMREAEAHARAREQETAGLKAQVDALIAEMEEVDARMALAEAELAAARSEADRATALATLSHLRAKRTQVQERLDKVKTGVRLKCPPDAPLC